MKPKATLRHFLLASTALISVSYTQAAQTWNGGDADDDLWSSLDNWGGALPTWASAINFGGNTRNSAINDLGLDALIGGINFTNAGSGSNTNAFTLSGDRIILGGNITTTANTAGSTITDVIDLDMSLDATRTITTNQQSATVQHNLTISGDISSSGAFGIIKAGSGILSLGGNNGYTGSTTVNAGTLRLTNTSALASSSALTMATGTTLQLRKDTTGGTFATPAWALTAGSSTTIDVNNITTGSGQTLALGSGATITNGTATINVTGGNTYSLSIPTINITATSVASGISFNPTLANVSIGTLTVLCNGKDAFVTLGGTSSNNSITTINDTSTGNTQFALYKDTSATWTLGDASVRNTVNISAGILKANGTITVGRSGTGRNLNLSGGELHYNNAGAVKFATGSTGGSINITGGSLDNTSGSAITTSTFNPAMTWGGNWTFIGSNGANSDLNLGTGAVVMSASRQVTVTNSATTLTVGGVVSGVGFSLTKAGAGTLTLSGINTYSGATTVSGGTLAIGTGGRINSSSGITIDSGAHFKYNSSTALTTGITNNGGRISGSGTIGVAVNLNSTSDIIAPGNSPGFQPYGVSQTWSSLTYEWETNNFAGITAGTDFDQINITGTLNLTGVAAGSYILDLISLTALNAAGSVPNFSEVNRSWAILTATGGITGFDASYWTIDHSTGSNTFTSSPTWGGSWSLSINDTAGTDSLFLTYTAVPEPRAALLGGLGMLMLLRRRRH